MSDLSSVPGEPVPKVQAEVLERDPVAVDLLIEHVEQTLRPQACSNGDLAGGQ